MQDFVICKPGSAKRDKFRSSDEAVSINYNVYNSSFMELHSGSL
jgi:hypothetical protein